MTKLIPYVTGHFLMVLVLFSAVLKVGLVDGFENYNLPFPWQVYVIGSIFELLISISVLFFFNWDGNGLKHISFLGIVLFVALSAFAGYSFFAGYSSCGCAGGVDTSPALFFVIDVVGILTFLHLWKASHSENDFPIDGIGVVRSASRIAALFVLVFFSAGVLRFASLQAPEAILTGGVFASIESRRKDMIVDFEKGHRSIELISVNNPTLQTVEVVNVVAACAVDPGQVRKFSIPPFSSRSLPVSLIIPSSKNLEEMPEVHQKEHKLSVRFVVANHILENIEVSFNVLSRSHQSLIGSPSS